MMGEILSAEVALGGDLAENDTEREKGGEKEREEETEGERERERERERENIRDFFPTTTPSSILRVGVS